MGAWGTAIFSDDVAADVREEWRDHLGDGLTPEEATERIVDAYREALDDPDDRPVVWLALAVAQWKTGRLRRGPIRWERSADRRARERVLEKTRQMLESPQPPAKRLPRRARSETPFVPGDVVAYLHESGNYFAFWVTGNWGDRGGMYSDLELLDFVGPVVPPPAALVSRPAKLRHWLPKPDGTVNPPERAGFVLVHADRLPASRYRVLGNHPRPPGRPECQCIVVPPSELDAALRRFLP